MSTLQHSMNNTPLYIIDSDNILQEIYMTTRMSITNVKIISLDQMIGASWESRYEYRFIYITNLPLELWKAFNGSVQ